MFKPVYIMMVGVPGSGKSTIIYEFSKFLHEKTTMLLSTDNYIDVMAQRLGKTYSEIFQDYIKEAEKDLNQKREWAIQYDCNIIHDQTNLTVKSRKDKIAKIPKHYVKIALFMTTPSDEELERRLSSRPGKFIPPKVIEMMKQSLTYPTYDEGFDHIFITDAIGLKQLEGVLNDYS